VFLVWLNNCVGWSSGGSTTGVKLLLREDSNEL
jgi:hypothetical protein